MRIALFDDRYPLVYGAQENLLLLGEAAAAQGHDVVFLTTHEGALAAAARKRGLNTLVCEAPKALLRFERELLMGGTAQMLTTTRALTSYSFRLHRQLRRHQIDVVVASAVRPTVLLLVTGLVRRPRILLYAQNSTPLGMIAALAAAYAWRIALIADGAAATFPRWARTLIRHKSRLLPSGRSFDAWASIVRSAPNPVPRVLSVASITPRKGLDLVIEAVGAAQEQVGPLDLRIVGGTTGAKSEEYLHELRARAEHRGVEVTFSGWTDDVVPHYADADIFVLGSYHEGLPGVLLEAMAAGLPCVTTDAGGAGELVQACGAGFVTPKGDVSAMAKRIAQLIADRQAWCSASTTGRARVLGTYGLDAFQQRFQSILSEASQGSEG